MADDYRVDITSSAILEGSLLITLEIYGPEMQEPISWTLHLKPSSRVREVYQLEATGLRLTKKHLQRLLEVVDQELEKRIS